MADGAVWSDSEFSSSGQSSESDREAATKNRRDSLAMSLAKRGSVCRGRNRLASLRMSPSRRRAYSPRSLFAEGADYDTTSGETSASNTDAPPRRKFRSLNYSPRETESEATGYATSRNPSSNPEGNTEEHITRLLLEKAAQERQDLKNRGATNRLCLLAVRKGPSGWIGLEFDGTRVVTVSHGGPADLAGIKKGYRLVTINGERIPDREDTEWVRSALHHAPDDFTITVDTTFASPMEDPIAPHRGSRRDSTQPGRQKAKDEFTRLFLTAMYSTHSPADCYKVENLIAHVAKGTHNLKELVPHVCKRYGLSDAQKSDWLKLHESVELSCFILRQFASMHGKELDSRSLLDIHLNEATSVLEARQKVLHGLCKLHEANYKKWCNEVPLALRHVLFPFSGTIPALVAALAIIVKAATEPKRERRQSISLPGTPNTPALPACHTPPVRRSPFSFPSTPPPDPPELTRNSPNNSVRSKPSSPRITRQFQLRVEVQTPSVDSEEDVGTPHLEIGKPFNPSEPPRDRKASRDLPPRPADRRSSHDKCCSDSDLGFNKTSSTRKRRSRDNAERDTDQLIRGKSEARLVAVEKELEEAYGIIDRLNDEVDKAGNGRDQAMMEAEMERMLLKKLYAEKKESDERLSELQRKLECANDELRQLRDNQSRGESTLRAPQGAPGTSTVSGTSVELEGRIAELERTQREREQQHRNEAKKLKRESERLRIELQIMKDKCKQEEGSRSERRCSEHLLQRVESLDPAAQRQQQREREQLIELKSQYTWAMAVLDRLGVTSTLKPPSGPDDLPPELVNAVRHRISSLELVNELRRNTPPTG